MPVRIQGFEPLSPEELDALRRRRSGKTNPDMEALLDAVASGTAVRVPVGEGQSARGVRVAISRAANRRGLAVETLEGDGFVAVAPAKQRQTRRGAQEQPPEGQRRRGRPPKRRGNEEAEIVSLEDLAHGEA